MLMNRAESKSRWLDLQPVRMTAIDARGPEPPRTYGGRRVSHQCDRARRSGDRSTGDRAGSDQAARDR
jgi:hypothetical protein